MTKSLLRSRSSSPAIAPLVLGATAAVAGAAFARLARASATQETSDVDQLVLEKTATHPQHPLRKTARALTPFGKWYTYVPVALGVARFVLENPKPRRKRNRRNRSQRAGASAVAASGIAAFALNKAFDRWLPQPPAPPGHAPHKPVFPSGHAFGPTAVGLVSSYVMGRQGLSSPAKSLPIAMAVPLVAATTRVLEKKHWGSDVAGGVVGGVAVAGAILAAYELTRER